MRLLVFVYYVGFCCCRPFLPQWLSHGVPHRARGLPHDVRKPPKDKGGGVRKDSNTMPMSVDYIDILVDMSDGVSSLSSFASIMLVMWVVAPPPPLPCSCMG